MNADTALRVAIAVASTGIAISSAEHLALLHEFRRGKIFTPILQIDSRLVRSKSGHSALVLLRSREFLAAMLVSRLVASILVVPLVLTAAPHYSIALLWTVVITSLYVDWRRRIGGDGGEQMSMLIVLSSAVAFTIAPGEAGIKAAAIFIAAQACLAYLSAGIAKIISPIWRSGDALKNILNTSTYGSAWFVRHICGRPAVSRLLNWSVIAAEVVFPFVVILPKDACIAVFAAGLGFHLVNAAVMGLNNFVWAFAATYPCIYWVATEALPRYGMTKSHS